MTSITNPRLKKKKVKYGTYGPARTMKKYNRSVSTYMAKNAKQITAVSKPHSFYQLVPKSVVKFPKALELLFDTKVIYKDVATSRYEFFMNETASAVLNAQISALRTVKNHSQSGKCKIRYFARYSRVASFTRLMRPLQKQILQRRASQNCQI